MEIKAHFDHFNINVSDLERSMRFYTQALSLEKTGEIKASDNSFTIVYMSRPGEKFRLELTCLHDHPQQYELGENETHLALRVEDFDAVHDFHREMGVICFENEAMGIYFIEDPDGYWIEIIPPKH